MLRLKRIVEGLTTVLVGVMIIANSVGVLSWRVWGTVLSLWPLLLVAIGLDLIGKGAKLSVVRVFSSLLVLGGLLYATASGPAGGIAWSTGWGNAEDFDVVSSSSARVDEAGATIAIPVGSLDIGEGSDLFRASGSLPYRAPQLTEERSGRRADLELSSDEDGTVLVFASEAYADIELDPGVVWDLEVETGATEADVDLSDFEVAGFTLESGVAVLDLKLGEPAADGTRDVPIRVSSGISVVSIRIPEGVEARVDARLGLGDANVPQGWTRVSDDRSWESDGFADATTRYVIVVEGGIGTVDVVID